VLWRKVGVSIPVHDAVPRRTPRSAVLWRKGSFGWESEAVNRFVERLLTVAAACRQQGWSLPFLVLLAV